MIRLFLVFVLAVALGAGLSTCGKKGDLQAPPEQEDDVRS